MNSDRPDASTSPVPLTSTALPDEIPDEVVGTPLGEPPSEQEVEDLAEPSSAWALFKVFRHRNYRLFFSGQLVSLMGTWRAHGLDEALYDAWRAGVVLCPAAQAHLVTTGLGPIYDGVGHFFLSPEDVLIAIALALFAGMRGPAAGRILAPLGIKLLMEPIKWLLVRWRGASGQDEERRHDG